MHDAALIRREVVAFGTTAFHFTRPAGFDYLPGQAMDVVLDDAAAAAHADDARHAFSIVSAPFEGELVIATRMRASPFKQALNALSRGAAIKLDGPFGTLTLEDDSARAAVFIAGGIGITPFMSILRQAAHDRLQHPLVLLYSNHRPEDAPFLDELEQMQRSNANFRMVATMTRMRDSRRAWRGHTGIVDDRLLAVAAADLAKPIYYVAGPPAMVSGVCDTLELAGVVDADIRSEEFFGY